MAIRLAGDVYKIRILYTVAPHHNLFANTSFVQLFKSKGDKI